MGITLHCYVCCFFLSLDVFAVSYESVHIVKSVYIKDIMLKVWKDISGNSIIQHFVISWSLFENRFA